MKERSGTTIRKGGRPSQSQSGLIRDQILDIATDFFLAQGYGATSIEAIAKSAGMSKRTFYHRFTDKTELFGTVVHRLVTRMRPPHAEELFKGNTLEDILRKLARAMLHAALSPEALALHRLIVSEAARFPELTTIMEAEGSRKEGVKLIAQLLEHYIRPADPVFAAEQFMQMVISIPQQRALARSSVMTQQALDNWADKTVDLFLNGSKNHTA